MLALLASLSLAGPGPTGVEPEPTLLEPFPFRHVDHARAFFSSGVSCTDCHPLGLVAEPLVEKVPPPRTVCHGCHRAELPGAPRSAGSACGQCHADLMELLPVNHGLGWSDAHAAEARAAGSGCSDCHESRWCFACHDDRGPLSVNPHGPGFRVTHGIEARLDPRSCTTCHSGEACIQCHETGSLPW